MSELISQIFANLPDWARIIISVLTVVGVALVFVFIIYTIWKYANAVVRNQEYLIYLSKISNFWKKIDRLDILTPY